MSEARQDQEESASVDAPKAEFFHDSRGNPMPISQEEFIKTLQAGPASVPSLELLDYNWLESEWFDRPMACYAVYNNTKQIGKRYYVIEPWLRPAQEKILEYLYNKIPEFIDISFDDITESKEERAERISTAVRELLQYHEHYGRTDTGTSIFHKLNPFGRGTPEIQLTPEEVQEIKYYLLRDFIGYGVIEPFRYDGEVEDISCNQTETWVYIDHEQHGSIPTNVSIDEEKDLAEYIKSLAGKASVGISKRNPEESAQLPDGSRATLILGEEINTKGSSFTIRQFKEAPFTPVDLINWGTFNLEQMAYLWLLTEGEMNGVIAGETSSGKTTTLNALSMFLPGNEKIATLEDTPELRLPHENWVAHTTREAMHDSDTASYPMGRVLRTILREDPTYILVGEIRGNEDTETSSNEGKVLFEAMNTGHCSFSTVHADNIQQVTSRFTTDPMNVSRSDYKALDWALVLGTYKEGQESGGKYRRVKTITEFDEFNEQESKMEMSEIHRYHPETDGFSKGDSSDLLREIQRTRSWTKQKLEIEKKLRQYVLAYLAYNEINSYFEVGAVLQAYMRNPARILALMAKEELSEHIDSLGDIIGFDISRADEDETLKRPSPDDRPGVKTELIRCLRENRPYVEEFVDLDPEWSLSDQPELTGRTASAGADRDSESGTATAQSQGSGTETSAGQGPAAETAQGPASSSEDSARQKRAAGQSTTSDGDQDQYPDPSGQDDQSEPGEVGEPPLPSEMGDPSALGQSVHGALPSGEDTEGEAVGGDVHLDVLTGPLEVDDGKIKRETERAQEEFSDLYDNEGDDGDMFEDIVQETGTDSGVQDEVIEAASQDEVSNNGTRDGEDPFEEVVEEVDGGDSEDMSEGATATSDEETAADSVQSSGLQSTETTNRNRGQNGAEGREPDEIPASEIEGITEELRDVEESRSEGADEESIPTDESIAGENKDIVGLFDRDGDKAEDGSQGREGRASDESDADSTTKGNDSSDHKGSKGNTDSSSED